MKKTFVVLVLLGGALGIGYATSWPGFVFGSKTSAEGKTDSAPETPVAGDPATLFESGKAAEAASLLEKKMADGSPTASDLKLLARCYRSLGKPDGEREAWQKILDRHASDPACADAHFGLGVISREQGKAEEAEAHFEKAAAEHGRTEGGWRSAAELGDLHRSRGDKAKACRAYSRALVEASGPERDRIRKLAADLGGELFYGRTPCEDFAVHAVQPGDSLARIALANRSTVGMIKVLNRLQGTVIHPGQELRIPKKEVRLEVVKSRFLLTVYLGDYWFKDYVVGIGKDNATPETEFEVDTKIENPPWHWGGKVIPPEDPENILGTRWMGFKKKQGLQGFGIHGARDPSSVPGAVSKGCIRMKNEDVEDLFELVPRGTKVLIRA